MNDYPFPNHPTDEEEAERVDYLIQKEIDEHECNTKTNQGTE